MPLSGDEKQKRGDVEKGRDVQHVELASSVVMFWLRVTRFPALERRPNVCVVTSIFFFFFCIRVLIIFTD